uniref:Semaphorin-1A n=1 Tax=Romanomermis culicivorax TaxID=13658 RepID=A0A915L2U6_ROMCU
MGLKRVRNANLTKNAVFEISFVPFHFSESENEQSKLIIISRDEVKTAPLHFCANKTNCGACVRLRDPYCAWDADNGNCIAVTNGRWPKDRNLIQNVLTGQARNCPSGDLDIEFYNINELYAPSTSNDFSQMPGAYSAESMALAVVLTITLASVLGFFVGYRLASSSNWRQNSTNQNHGGGVNKGDQSPACSADDDYEAPPSYKSNAPSSDFYESAMSALRRPLTASSATEKFTFDVVGNLPNDCLTFDSCKQESVKLNNFLLTGKTCDKNFLPPPPIGSTLPPPIGSTLPRDYKGGVFDRGEFNGRGHFTKKCLMSVEKNCNS